MAGLLAVLDVLVLDGSYSKVTVWLVSIVGR
jgi:hypothetical protein